MYTQCPHCDTLFRIQVADLKTAHGKVRCGHCGQIFNALRFLSEELPEIPTVFEEVELPAPEVEPAGIVADEPHSTEELLGLVDKLVSELEPTPNPAEDHAAPDLEHPQLSEPLPITQQDEAPLLSDVAEFQRIDVHDAASDGASFESSDITFSIVEPSADAAREIAHSAVRARAARTQPYNGMDTLSWSVGVLVLLALLAAQYIYYMRAELSQNAALRPWLEHYCSVAENIVPCEIPPLQDVARIKIQSSEISLHPSIQNVLLVHLSLVNQASFAQPYPDLQLTVSDLGGRHFAQRRFHPAEYLPGGNVNTAGMPGNVAIPISLEIAAPFSPVNLEASSWSVKLY